MNKIGIVKQLLNIATKQKAFLAVVMIFVAMLFSKTNFFSAYNMFSLLAAVSILMILAYGETVVLVAGGVDLSIGGVMVVSGIIAILLINSGVPILIAILISLFFGAIVGAINGYLSVYQRTEPFIITLGMGIVLTGIAQQLTDAHPISCENPNFVNISNTKLFDVIPSVVLAMFAVLIIIHYILRYTAYGRNCYAIGGDYEVAKYSGINVLRTKAATYIISGMTAALGGIMLSSMLNSGNSTYGDTTALMVACGVVVGGTSFAGGIGSVPQSAIGLLAFGVLQNAMNMLNIDAYVQQICLGVVIVTIIALDCYGRKLKREAV